MTGIISYDSESPAIGKQVITAAAFIHQDFNGVEKVFLPKRSTRKKFMPGKYELPGGHLDFGEDITIGLKREITEELGVDINVGDPFYVFTYKNKVKGSHSIEVVYFATLISSLSGIQLNPQDHSEYKWIAEEEIGKIINNKGADDPEVKAILKGFSLLKGSSLNFG
ncbi:NUDIX hydrolase [Candidatus Roizmanbacteria bacterium]|nr:NUDIX hydrolase [Candidatus Roizmanbacteria bacterium]